MPWISWLIGGSIILAAALILIRYVGRGAKARCGGDGCEKNPGGCAGCQYAGELPKKVKKEE